MDGQELKRTASFEVMREMLSSFGDALSSSGSLAPSEVRSDDDSTALCSAEAEGEGEEGPSKAELSLRAQ